MTSNRRSKLVFIVLCSIVIIAADATYVFSRDSETQALGFGTAMMTICALPPSDAPPFSRDIGCRWILRGVTLMAVNLISLTLVAHFWRGR